MSEEENINSKSVEENTSDKKISSENVNHINVKVWRINSTSFFMIQLYFLEY